ncbi:hypothetical protein I3760_10G122900 [Carya illinoinensis]|uniref:Uncharacterized protein n=1 Tax=Carya illinoinensis TaxID=32201 RepID=A0A922J305_CARIL|nr:hypothetical protein I3760_10G122900 [Carya illinoinensis]KAG6692631.1 hypothetical protein I3842_10G124300 [Carya illinoinensis]
MQKPKLLDSGNFLCHIYMKFFIGFIRITRGVLDAHSLCPKTWQYAFSLSTNHSGILVP